MPKPTHKTNVTEDWKPPAAEERAPRDQERGQHKLDSCVAGVVLLAMCGALVAACVSTASIMLWWKHLSAMILVLPFLTTLSFYGWVEFCGSGLLNCCASMMCGKCIDVIKYCYSVVYRELAGSGRNC